MKVLSRRQIIEDWFFTICTILVVGVPFLLVFAVAWGFYRDVQIEKQCATICSEKGAFVEKCVEGKTAIVAMCSSPTEGRFVAVKKTEE